MFNGNTDNWAAIFVWEFAFSFFFCFPVVKLCDFKQTKKKKQLIDSDAWCDQKQMYLINFKHGSGESMVEPMFHISESMREPTSD